MKLDIEGSEFSVLESMNFMELSFGQILVEFHERFITNGKKLLHNVINILREHGYYCFAASVFHEFGFVNKKRYDESITALSGHKNLLTRGDF